MYGVNSQGKFMADYIRCCRGEKFFAPTILYQMQQITPYILKTQEWRVSEKGSIWQKVALSFCILI
jgi:hypothetical protein